jgi:hypothetical protein
LTRVTRSRRLFRRPGDDGTGRSGSPARGLGTDGFWLGAPPPVLAAIHARLAGVPTWKKPAADAPRTSRLKIGPISPAPDLPDYFRWRWAWTPRSTTPRGYASVGSRSCAFATAATSTGGWSAWTWPVRGPHPLDRIESDASEAGRVTSVGRCLTAAASRWRCLPALRGLF